MPIGLAPGPKSPHDHNSFLAPFCDELLQLAHGVTTPNLLTEEYFMLRAFLLTKMEDMIDIKSNQYIKGPNAFSPCQKCRIQGCRDPDHSSGNYYYPLKAPQGAICLDKSPGIDYDSHDLPMCRDEGCKEALANIQVASTAKEKKRREKVHGLKGESILLELPGSVAFEVFHMILCICSLRISFRTWWTFGVALIRDWMKEVEITNYLLMYGAQWVKKPPWLH
ncbi:hypothetical protein M422DRAFT_53484 [Sphaerobolus stellatus SS14]|uniref:Uncharacterized protein n=1 Tax=Sphaerobolus stellatus (strain SS14) TaxID=990650 RepID=A0A0C9V168_SPHS4|nr:hypothetical protein M422DRAFT_53484 [Sphaerobolus stellatus SS14]